MIWVMQISVIIEKYPSPILKRNKVWIVCWFCKHEL